MAGTNEEMLINLDSPEKNSNSLVHNHYLKNPLIPGPDLNCNELESNNPFDIVAQSAENWDPFELVLHQSLMHYGKIDHSHVERNDKLVDGDFSYSRENNCRLNRSNSVSNNIKFFPTSEKHSDQSDVEILNISSHSLDNSPSLRDKIKRVVKKRVSKCIERALNGNTSLVDLSKDEISSPMKSQNTISVENNLRSSRTLKLKKVEMEDYDLKHVLEEAKQLSVIVHNMSLNEETNISPIRVKKNSQLKEQKILISEPKVLFHDEDLMSIKPPWDGIDNDSSDSDDNSIGLPKVKLFYVKKKEKGKKNELNEEKLAHYKKRIRASIDGNMSCDEDTTVQEAISKCIPPQELELKIVEEPLIGKKTKTTLIEVEEKEPIELFAVNKPIVPVMNDLRLKKVGNILKKGPLKAMVPLQKMTKSIAEKMSPLKKNSSTNKLKLKFNEDSTLSSSLICPVATSTPNNKKSVIHKKNVESSFDSKSRPRLSRKDIELTGNIRRSVSLSTDTRKRSQTKQPFSSINPNENLKSKRPHTAPSPNARLTLKSNPQLKKKVDKGCMELWVRSARPALPLGVHFIPIKNSQQQYHFI